MIFIYKAWDEFCEKLYKKGIKSIQAKEVSNEMKSFLVLKHDVENNVSKAYELANIEHKYGHRGTYYVQAYLLDDSKNVKLLNKMQKMGHEITYHHDVMDSNKGDIKSAIQEFSENKIKFEKNGFTVKTVCQHGNPIIERVGYSSNRDFFRNVDVQNLYPDIVDVMVNYKEKYKIDYIYYSDAGRKFNLIYDPINNDVINSDDKNIPFENLEILIDKLDDKSIISIHPHRWTKSTFSYILKEKSFKIIKGIAKSLIKIPLFKKIMSRYYYLAKKI